MHKYLQITSSGNTSMYLPLSSIYQDLSSTAPGTWTGPPQPGPWGTAPPSLQACTPPPGPGGTTPPGPLACTSPPGPLGTPPGLLACTPPPGL